MIKDIRIYPWKTYSDTSYVLTKISTPDSSYSTITALSDEFIKSKKRLSSLRKNLAAMDEDYWESADEMLEEINVKSDSDPGLLLGTSLSMCKAATKGDLWMIDEVKQNMIFPRVWLSVIRGRVSGSGSDWRDFMILPEKVKDTLDMQDRLIGSWSEIGEELNRKKTLAGKDIENRWISSMNTEQTLELLSGICAEMNLSLGIDCGSWRPSKNNIYDYRNEKKKLTEEKHKDFLKEMCNKYAIKYLEDPFVPGSYDLLEELKTGLKAEISIDVRNENSFQKVLENKNVTILDNSPDLFFNFSGIKKYVKFISEKGKNAVFSAPEYAIQDPWVADLCIALKVPFIKADPSTGKGVLNRLSELWHDVPNEVI
ncbi:MAG: hypothetical protein JW716_00795 [Candidatus Aenigmarchaeota archaeon]|nr:hypothetical protein [Candidatus Aenigmarchaeota archaeon]